MDGRGVRVDERVDGRGVRVGWTCGRMLCACGWTFGWMMTDGGCVCVCVLTGMVWIKSSYESVYPEFGFLECHKATQFCSDVVCVKFCMLPIPINRS